MQQPPIKYIYKCRCIAIVRLLTAATRIFYPLILSLPTGCNRHVSFESELSFRFAPFDFNQTLTLNLLEMSYVNYANSSFMFIWSFCSSFKIFHHSIGQLGVNTLHFYFTIPDNWMCHIQTSFTCEKKWITTTGWMF